MRKLFKGTAVFEQTHIQPCSQGLPGARKEGRKMRDPGNEVELHHNGKDKHKHKYTSHKDRVNSVLKPSIMLMLIMIRMFFNYEGQINVLPCSSVWRRSGLVVSALDSGASSPGFSPGQGHCVVFLGKTLYSHSAPLHPGV